MRASGENRKFARDGGEADGPQRTTVGVDFSCRHFRIDVRNEGDDFVEVGNIGAVKIDLKRSWRRLRRAKCEEREANHEDRVIQLR